MPRFISFAALTAASFAVAAPAVAQDAPGPKARRDVPGFECRLVRQTDDTRAGNLPASRSLPSPDAPLVEGGRLGSVAFVGTGGGHNGYAQLLLPDARTAWIERDWLTPWRKGVCRVVVLDNGRIGFQVRDATAAR